MVNYGTVTVGAGAVIGAGFWGVKKVREWRVQVQQQQRNGRLTPAIASNLPFSKTVLGQSVCATAAGWFQVYSGGIAIDTVATRLQAGQTMGQSLWGVSAKTKDVGALMRRYSQVTGTPLYQVRWDLLRRSNLAAGHFVTMLARFPYLFVNFNTYVQTDNFLAQQFPSEARQDSGGLSKPMWRELACVLTATVVSSLVITAAECPKIIDQCRPPEEACREKATILGIVRTQGIGRLMQGYSACFMREFLFNSALLGAPTLAEVIRHDFVEPNLASSTSAQLIQGKELVISSLVLGLGLGLLTNGPDQMKTNIQYGTFRNMSEHWKWQKANGGLRALYGTAAVYRAIYIGHAVLAFNFARSYVEDLLDARSGRSADPEDTAPAVRTRSIRVAGAAQQPQHRRGREVGSRRGHNQHGQTAAELRSRLETLRRIEEQLLRQSQSQSAPEVARDVRAEKQRIKE